MAQRLEHEGEARVEATTARVDSSPGQRAEAPLQRRDADEVHGEQRAGERAIDQRSIDDRVHFPQPVAQQREGEGDGNHHHRQVEGGDADQRVEDAGDARRAQRRDEDRRQLEQDDAADGDGDAEHVPFDLLALRRVGEASVALDLGDAAGDEAADREQRMSSDMHGAGSVRAGGRPAVGARELREEDVADDDGEHPEGGQEPL